MFSGSLFVTQTIMKKLTPIEISEISDDILKFVQEKNGVDYFQVYEDDEGQKLYLIDELNREMIESGQYEAKDNHCTLLFSWEY